MGFLGDQKAIKEWDTVADKRDKRVIIKGHLRRRWNRELTREKRDKKEQ